MANNGLIGGLLKKPPLTLPFFSKEKASTPAVTDVDAFI